MPFSADRAVCIPVLGSAAMVGYFLYKFFVCKSKSCGGRVNCCQQMDSPKVVHSFDIEDLGSETCYCRCWKSSKFPYCDGSHNKHDKETGDNVGPLIIKRKAK